MEQLLYRSPGGIGRYTAQLLSVLPMVEPSDEVIPFAARHPRAVVDAALVRAGAGGLVGQVAVSPLPRAVLYEGWMGPGWPPLTWRVPRLREVDVVHSPSIAVPPRGRIPLIVTVHDAAPMVHPETYPANGLRFHRRGLRATARRADLVITVSQAAAAEVVVHTDIPEERIRVVPHGVEVPRPSDGARDAVLARHDLLGTPYILWVGSREPRKNVGTLVAAAAELHRRHSSPARLVLAGYPGWLGADLVSDKDRAALGPSLRELGAVGDDELWALYAGATVFAFPSRHEGFGLPVIEAMALGTPVVCSELPVLREVAGDAAWYVAADDVSGWIAALSALLGDPSQRAGMVALGAARARQFSVAAFAERTRAVYHEALSLNGRAG